MNESIGTHISTESEGGQEFWRARPVLSHIRDFARSRMCGPWSTLGVVLARAVASVPPHVQLPGVVGGPMSLNMFVGLVGPSGAGKGASESAAREAVLFADHAGSPIPVPELPLGSGEGISRTFRPAGLDKDAPNEVDRVLFSVPEVDTLASLFGRQGATLEGELRKLYSGEALGFTNAQKATRSVVAAQSYRAVVTVGVQPLRAEALFAGADGGTTQRFVWMDVRDPQAPDTAPPQPDPWQVRMPDWPPAPLLIPNVAIQEIRRNRLAQLRGENVDPLNGHALLCRLKVAAALMILDGRAAIGQEDWALAGDVMSVSTTTRTEIQAAMNAQAAHANRAKAIAAVEREEAGEDHKRAKSASAAVNLLRRKGTRMTESAISKQVHSRYRAHLGGALPDLAEIGTLVQVEDHGEVYYELADAA